MKADLDSVMQAQSLDAIIVLGDEAPNPYNDYLTRRVRAGGIIIKKRVEEAVLIVGPMEVELARQSGLQVQTVYDFGMADLRRQYPDDPARLDRELYRIYLTNLGVGGRVALYGVADVAWVVRLFTGLQADFPNIEFVFDQAAVDLFAKLYETKDSHELDSLKEAARLTSQVMRDTRDFISQHRSENPGQGAGSRIVDASGEPLTIGAVKAFIRARELALGLDDPEGCIFAQGRDSAFPHSTGNDAEALLVGQNVVFDLFPRGLNSGYFHDITRTWCLGQASADVQAIYDDVWAIFSQVRDGLKVGEPSRRFQEMTLDFFEAHGHPTPRTHPGSFDGYIHSLGHGLGLNIHEAPNFSMYRESVPLAPGMVFTVEPGLYYPDRGFGVRIEDTVYLDENGTLQTLTDVPYDLVLPLKG